MRDGGVLLPQYRFFSRIISILNNPDFQSHNKRYDSVLESEVCGGVYGIRRTQSESIMNVIFLLYVKSYTICFGDALNSFEAARVPKSEGARLDVTIVGLF